MTLPFRHLLRSTAGSSAAEFALVLPLFLILLFGVIDAGRFMWEYNQAEKATQVGARVAVVTNVLASQLRDENYAGQTVGGPHSGQETVYRPASWNGEMHEHSLHVRSRSMSVRSWDTRYCDVH